MRDVIAEYEHLCRNAIIPNLPEAERGEVSATLDAIRRRVDGVFSRHGLTDAVQLAAEIESPTRPRPRSLANSPRYLGEPSDVRFFNLVKRVFQEESPLERDHEGMDSYEQDDADETSAFHPSIELPNPEIADGYLNMYFSTIHVAYPFVPKSSFMKTYRDLRENGVTEDIDVSWLALLCMLWPT